MNLFETYRNHVLNAIDALAKSGALPQGLKLDAITLEPPREYSHGDLSTNAAMVIAGQAKQKPREVAERIATALKDIPTITQVDIAGPGFINIRLDVSVWQSVLPVILEEGIGFGSSTLGGNASINVEYVSANPTGPMHIGHARGAVYGDALATLLVKAGYNVTREYYINDAGGQIDVLADSALLRYREACGEAIGEIPAGLYPGEYLKGVGQALVEKFGHELKRHAPEVAREMVKPFAIDAMMALIKHDLADMGIHHDVFTSEKKLRDDKKIEAAIALLEEKGHLYRGTLEPPKGEKPDDWEAAEQLLFRSTPYGDDMDRVVQKSDGAFTYFAGDLALTMDKLKRGFLTLIYMMGADHGGYVKRMEAAAKALSDGAATVDIKLNQLVHLYKNGEPFKMSKRAGNFVTVRDVLDEVGRDILRFVMLMRKTNQDMDFDFDKVKEQSKDNPVFYVQYAHARAKSLLRLGAEQLNPSPHRGEDGRGAGLASQNDLTHGNSAPTLTLPLRGRESLPDFSLLTHPAELALIKLLAQWPRQVEQAAIAHEPHRIIYYLQEVAASFHGLWNMGHQDSEIRFILPDQPALTATRLALARATAIVVASGLNVCGVEPVEELR